MAPGAIFDLSLVMYSGFTIPIKDMHPWFRWINYLNPVAYAYESLMINEVKAFEDVPILSLTNLVPQQHNTLYTIQSRVR
jgi:ABC-type multidrug transport system permease subunit